MTMAMLMMLVDDHDHVDDDDDDHVDDVDDDDDDQERLVIAAIGESGEGKSAFLNLVFFIMISIIFLMIMIIVFIFITIRRQNTCRQVLNSPGERKKFLEESELPELCTTQPRVHEVLDDYIPITDKMNMHRNLTFEYMNCQGLWRGDPCRPVTVVDTPGLGGEDGRDDDEV